MVTQLQDVANNVAQEKISNQRLRNEEIRRQMANPWTEPTSISSTQGTQPLQNVTSGPPTLASTYSGLLKNYQNITSSNSSRTEGNSFDGSYAGNPNPFGIPSWAPMAVGTGLNFAGAGIGAPIGAAFTSLARGDRAGAAGTLAGLFTNVVTEGKIPGLGGVVGSVASGLIRDKSATEIGQGVVNSLLGTGLSRVNPLLGAGYQALRFFGIDPARGLQNLFFPDKTVPESWRGTFTSSGYTPPAGSWMSSGNENYSPYGGSQYNRVRDSSSSGYNTSDGYGGYSPTMNYSSNSGSYWSGPSTSSSSSSYSSSGYPSSGSWSSYSSGSAYSSDSDSESSDGGW